ncbi:MAG: D-glycero-beta-D-manno-heptose-7-phosphate kinase [Gammaproteobacteria bacterium]|nr:D-glycero-beta-D-manno-heptose-7-phosphate kinase [Gammaproteobacteria bacterium]MBT5644565.1 D-glycero-beta-D-manno-heptose-7-phosphate kinase [Gammaproteobacteria bacterium]MBT7237026.1 D-glycero-beta-D-manno-heptose-7-phosphate kinase [Gammaproteobacteria bacterium]|tara:strand:- start:2170 stop:3096 length:927 start_codon:yes stop_codon:yes gene_type:complete
MISKKKILVIGDVMLDRYWMGQVNRISPEAPVPILDVCSSIDKPGGAANVAKNLSDFGMDVTLIGLTGKDEASVKLFDLISASKIDYKPIEDPNIRTTIKLRVIDKNKQIMRIDHEDKDLSKVVMDSYKPILKVLSTYDGIIISDYDKGMVKPLVKKILRKAVVLGIKTFVDPKGLDFSFYKKAFLLKPNLSEFEAIAGVSKNTKEFRSKGERLRKKLSLSFLLVTEGKKGMTLFEENKATSYSASQKDVFDVTGAGDTVVSILSSYIIAGKSISSAVKMSNLAAGLSVQKLGSTSVTQSELLNESKK